ncbi:MAG: lysylphosphatidylglycerol synthase transmembrane domain-containing protein [Thermoanaerobaculia bacterium]
MKNSLKILFGLFLTIILLWFFLYKTDLKMVYNLLKGTDLKLIGLAIIFNLFSVILRIFRLKIFLFPIKKTSLKTLFVAIFSSYFISTILPGRLGEITKPLYIAAEEEISRISCLTTAFLERIFDLFALFIFFTIFLFVYNLNNQKIPLQTFYKISFLGIFFLFLLFLLFFLWLKGKLKIPIFNFLKPALEKVKAGISSFKNPKEILLALLLTFLIWINVSLFTYLILKSFKLQLPFIASFMLLSISALGFVIPTPGGAGGVHKAFQVGLVFFYSLEYNLATAVSIVGHFFAMVPVALVGFLSLTIYGIPLSKFLNFAKIKKI